MPPERSANFYAVKPIYFPIKTRKHIGHQKCAGTVEQLKKNCRTEIYRNFVESSLTKDDELESIVFAIADRNCCNQKKNFFGWKTEN